MLGASTAIPPATRDWISGGGVQPLQAVARREQREAEVIAALGGAQVDALGRPSGGQVLSRPVVRRDVLGRQAGQVDGEQVLLGVLVQAQDQQAAGVRREEHREVAVLRQRIAGPQHRPHVPGRQIADHDVEAGALAGVARVGEQAAVRAVGIADAPVGDAEFVTRAVVRRQPFDGARRRIEFCQPVVLGAVRVGLDEQAAAVRAPHAPGHRAVDGQVAGLTRAVEVPQPRLRASGRIGQVGEPLAVGVRGDTGKPVVVEHQPLAGPCAAMAR
jgi:hypothetical protein